VTAVAQALAGLKVLEFGGYAAGPHIGKMLGNFGAHTIHVESKQRPDGFRIQYPPFKDDRPGYNRSGCFAFFNDSKCSVTVDLKKPAGVALTHRMAQWCDLVIENMRQGIMARLGLGYETLAKLNPRLVMLSTCNMGQTGPRADQPGFGSQLTALAGMCGLTGVPEGPPMLLYGPYIDYIASSLGASAALAAVIRSRRSGKGALIDLAQYECGLTFMGAALQDYFARGRCAERCGNDDPVAVPHGAYSCADGEWIALSCWSDADFAALAKVMGEGKLASDPRFASATARRANVEALDAAIAGWTETGRAEAVAESLQAAGVAAYPVVTMAGLFADPQLAARRQFRVRRHPEIGDHAYCFPGFDLADAPGDIVAPAPCVGADNDFVFRDLIGLSAAEYESYRRQGVFD
jgi:crotonobetainyl-CoA:carnitine CoA-transferase CaiB-like acyl-CoA transferase